MKRTFKGLWCCALAGLILLARMPSSADAGTAQSKTIKNTTGQVAHDLHVEVDYPFSETTAKAPPFNAATVAKGGKVASFTTGGTVPADGKVTVTWNGTSGWDNIMLGASYWTDETHEKIPVSGLGSGVDSAYLVQPTFTPIGSGMIQVALANSGAPVGYTDLAIAAAANDDYFDVDQYLTTGMASGTAVSLLVPSSGTLASGTTVIAQFTRSTADGLYDVGQITLDGDLLGFGALTPEPAGLALIGGCLALLGRRRPARS